MSSSTLSNKPRANWRLFAPSARCLDGLPPYAWLTRWLAAWMLLAARTTTAQEALWTSLAGNAAAEARRLQLQSLPYTVKSGDFKLLVTPSLALNWNDNINCSRDNAESDFILSPSIALNANYLVSAYNLLNLSVDFGYNKYINHDELSQWFLAAGSALSFDVYVKDFWINFHDQFQYTQDAAQNPTVAGTGRYGTFQNTVGLSGTWDLEDVTLTLGYDHQNVMSLSDQFNYNNDASESVVARAGVRIDPKLSVGVEGTTSFTTYDIAVLNNNQQYSAGIYGDWRPGSYFSVQPHVGYTIFESSQTSSFIKGENLSTWYANLTLAHQATDFLSYSLSAGHEITPASGIQSDAIEDSYIRPSVTWNAMKDVTLTASLSYEHGDEGGGQAASLLEKNFDWYTGGLGLSYSPMKKVSISLNYRLTLRYSNVASREYTQNMVGLQITYTPQ